MHELVHDVKLLHGRRRIDPGARSGKARAPGAFAAGGAQRHGVSGAEFCTSDALDALDSAVMNGMAPTYLTLFQGFVNPGKGPFCGCFRELCASTRMKD